MKLVVRCRFPWYIPFHLLEGQEENKNEAERIYNKIVICVFFYNHFCYSIKYKGK